MLDTNDLTFAKEDIKVLGVQYRYEEAVKASSDPAMIISDLDECKEPKRDYYSLEYSNTKVTCTNCWEGTYEPVGDPMAKIHHWFKCNKCGEHIEFLPSVTVE